MTARRDPPGQYACWAAAFAAVLAFGCNQHAPGRTSVRGGECFTCHQADYEATTNPAHPGVMPTTCGDCHSEEAWRPAMGGAHPEDEFPLTPGPHGTVACNDCHDESRGGFANGENTACVGCHLGSHDRSVVDPIHDGVAGYPAFAAEPNFCLTCHPSGTADVLQHPNDAFPIDTGPHVAAGTCFNCHDAERGSPQAGANTDCVGCHLGNHNRAAMDAQHSGVGGYPEAGSTQPPNFCLTCHPNGSAEAPEHPEQRFPITRGAHIGQSCASCHDASRGPNTAGANTSCTGCHLGVHDRSAMDEEHVGVPGYPLDEDAAPNFCLVCHPNGAADEVGHPESVFPIATAPHLFQCASCHKVDLGENTNGRNTDCVGCHTGSHTRSRMNARHEGISGYDADDSSPNFCLECHPSGRE